MSLCMVPGIALVIVGSAPLIILGLLLMVVALGNSQRQTFHDKTAGTVVTRPKRVTWSIDDEDTDG